MLNNVLTLFRLLEKVCCFTNMPFIKSNLIHLILLILKNSISLVKKKTYFYFCSLPCIRVYSFLLVRLLVCQLASWFGWSVCHNLLTGREVTLLCSCRSTSAVLQFNQKKKLIFRLFFRLMKTVLCRQYSLITNRYT